jgi:uncharacterized damage-inducible protein DinB
LLHHLAVVEHGFLAAIRGATEAPHLPADLEGIAADSKETAAGYADLLASGRDLAGEVYIPWWERSFSIEDCLYQVLAHSAQHRAEILWELARAGVDTGEIDYIVWVDQQGAE